MSEYFIELLCLLQLGQASRQAAQSLCNLAFSVVNDQAIANFNVSSLTCKLETG
ncbi:hypothetical protein [Sodalis endosymbiont of Henestaris halophilus]|uniref:hypothetical protein n=1 Tax=Sodalis endosymbiont of Henestaris halophilus TaxID=1929246 RepID=UPI0012FE34D6|nr:hypothetical protein [Sodalis endosymbiont of Henestaris halophilus]